MPVSVTAAISPGQSSGASSLRKPDQRSPSEPGLVLVFAAGRPFCALLPLGPSPVEVGRGRGLLSEHPDPVMSRRHALVEYRESRFSISDLGSCNGSAINGVPFRGATTAPAGSLVRFGQSLFCCCDDLKLLRQFGVQRRDGVAVGPAFLLCLRSVAHIAAASRNLFIMGERGDSRAVLARAFHQHGPRPEGPFVAINCASARTSCSPGPSEAQLAAAHGGTLFLDEVAALELKSQERLVPLIERGELRIAAAAEQELEAHADAGRLLQPLHGRLARPQVRIPTLWERWPELPFLIEQSVHAVDSAMTIELSLVEACYLRPWAGGAQELCAAVQLASLSARKRSEQVVTAAHLAHIEVSAL